MKYILKTLLLLLSLSNLVQANGLVLVSLVSLDEATKIVRQDKAKKILGAKTETIDGRDIHIIKVLTPDGRVQQIRVDAQSGKLLDKD